MSVKFTRRFFLCRFLLIGSFFIGAAADAAPKAAIDPLDHLLGAPHGLSPLSGPEVAKALEEVKKNPAPYLGRLGEALSPDKIAADESGEAARRAENAVAVLVAVGDGGRATLLAHFQKLQAAAERLEKAPAVKRPDALKGAQARAGRVQHVQLAVINQLAASGDARLRDTLLADFPKANYSFQLSALTYFERTSKGDPAVKARLKPELDARSSPWFNSPRLRALVEGSAKGP